MKDIWFFFAVWNSEIDLFIVSKSCRRVRVNCVIITNSRCGRCLPPHWISVQNKYFRKSSQQYFAASNYGHGSPGININYWSLNWCNTFGGSAQSIVSKCVSNLVYINDNGRGEIALHTLQFLFPCTKLLFYPPRTYSG